MIESSCKKANFEFLPKKIFQWLKFIWCCTLFYFASFNTSKLYCLKIWSQKLTFGNMYGSSKYICWHWSKSLRIIDFFEKVQKGQQSLRIFVLSRNPCRQTPTCILHCIHSYEVIKWYLFFYNLKILRSHNVVEFWPRSDSM